MNSIMRYHRTLRINKIHERESGYYVLFEGSGEAVYFGPDAPPWSVGDHVEVTYKKVEVAGNDPNSLQETA